MRLQKLVVMLGLSLVFMASCSKGEKVGLYFGGRVVGTGNAPISSAITPAAFNEDTQSIITLSYIDQENDNGTSCTLSALTNVTITQACTCDGSGVCTVGVTGTSNYFGAASFDYTVTAAGQTSNSSVATLSITAVNDAPVSSAITPVAFNEDTQSIITLSYIDQENDNAATCTLSALTNVTITQPCACNGSGVCTVGVTGTSNYFGPASFGYTVTAAGQTSNSSVATLSITAVNDAPVSSNITPVVFNEDTQSIITLSYTDQENDNAATCTLSTLTNVTITQACACNGFGVCSVGVTGTSNYFGAASFDYTVTAAGQTSNTSVATLSIITVNDAPVSSAITPAAFNEDTQSIITLSYTDQENDNAATCTLSTLTNVTITQACACNGSGVCTVGVTGTSNYFGAASFDYTVTAAGQTSNSSAATLSITAVNDAPVSSAITPAAFNEDTQSIITLSYIDQENENATSCTLSALTNVTITQACACNGSGVCTVGVTGTSNYFGAASFDYTVTAGGQTSNISAATLSITTINDAPVSSAITPAAFNEDTQSIITLSYTDQENDNAATCTLSALTNVTITQACACNGSGVCTVGVTGTSNYFGAASFDYTVTAAGQTSNSSAATLSITAVNDAPVSSNITPAAFNEDTQSIITLSYIDQENDNGTSCTLSALTNVTITQACACNGSGVCTVGVTGTSNYFGAASFDYTVTAAGQTSNTSAATLSITAVNDAPVSSAITPAAFNEDTQSIITLSYTDLENDNAATCTLSTLTNVTITQACACNGSGVCTVGVTGTSNYFGAASFGYTVTAAGQTSNSSVATLSITAVNDAPVSSAITPAAFNEDTQSIITLSYIDQENDNAATCTLSALTNVTITQACACNGSGVCTVGVTGASNYFGAASFGYTVTAAGQTSNSSVATLSITAVNDAPVSSAITPAAFNEDTQSIMTLSYTDQENDNAATCTLSALTNVTITQACACNGSGVCTVGVTGTSNYFGAASFGYTVTAAGQTSNTSAATLSITAVDDAPVADDINRGPYNQDLQSIVTLAYSDVENNLATSCTISAPSNVTVTQPCACNVAGVCTVGITGTPSYYGSASFDYTVTANAVISNTATSSISVICPTSYIAVPGNTDDVGTDDFCVMQHEAKNVGGVATSQEALTPWVSIGIGNARTECTDLGLGFDLLSNPEWMTIARNIEVQASNWFGGMNIGYVYQGNVNGDINWSYGPGVTAVAFGPARDIKARLTLSNGQHIWDLSGNVWEWVDWSTNAGLQAGPTTCHSGGIIEVKDASCMGLNSGDYLPLNTGLTTGNGIGIFYADSSSAQSYASRGGRFLNPTNTGIYALYMDDPINNPSPNIGFRCVYRPSP